MFRQRKHSAMRPYQDRKRFPNSSPKLQFWRRVFKTQLQNCSFGDEFCKTRRNFFFDGISQNSSSKLQFWWRVLKTQLWNCSFGDEFSKLNSKTAVLTTSFQNSTPKLQFWWRVFQNSSAFFLVGCTWPHFTTDVVRTCFEVLHVWGQGCDTSSTVFHIGDFGRTVEVRKNILKEFLFAIE